MSFNEFSKPALIEPGIKYFFLLMKKIILPLIELRIAYVPVKSFIQVNLQCLAGK
jgi:hypothetical protein